MGGISFHKMSFETAAARYKLPVQTVAELDLSLIERVVLQARLNKPKKFGKHGGSESWRWEKWASDRLVQVRFHLLSQLYVSNLHHVFAGSGFEGWDSCETHTHRDF